MISAQASGGGAVPSGMLWWKVELDKSGAILSVEQVADVAKGSKLVTYVQATTKAEACTAAKDWYANHRAYHNERDRDKRAQRLAAGMCSQCGKRELSTKWFCRPCADKINLIHKERRAGHAPLIQRHPTAEAALEAHRLYERNKRKRHPACQKSYAKLWDKLQAEGVRAFELWLVQNMSDVERQERGLDVAKAAE